MRAHQSTPSFVNLLNVVDLSFYRRENQLRSYCPSGFQKQRTLRARETLQVEYWLDGNHRERMKVNLVVFVFLIFLIMIFLRSSMLGGQLRDRTVDGEGCAAKKRFDIRR